MRRHSPTLALFLCACAALAAQRQIEFNRDVRPILADKCFLCHGPDAKAKNIPRRLDQEAEAKAARNGTRAIVEGDPASSELIRRITAENKGVRMPPHYSGLKLTEPEIETLRLWIAQGAKWQKHWSLIPPVSHPLPEVKDGNWARNPIDRFILARLDREGLSPSPEAARETLLRRVSLDLTGLPPSPAGIDAFLVDRSPGAYEKAVDRLLASPRYGERMAARWLDAARYADTNGYQYDGERQMWRWRDWVIDSFNSNQPYDRFALEQVAGDLLPNATREQKIATAFNRNHRANTEDGIIAEEYAVEYVVDRIETTSTVFLGLTLGCTRCHNHKYDPFTQKEFYQLFAYFDQVPELGRAMKYGNSPPLVPAPTREQQRRLDELEQKIHAAEDILRRNDARLRNAQSAWERTLANSETLYWAPPAALEASYSLEEDEPGRIGRAARFDGKRQIEAGQVVKFDIEDRFSLSAWIYSGETPDGPIVSEMSDKPKGRGFGLHANHGKLHAHLTGVWESDALRVNSEETLEPRRWHHVAMTYTGSRMAEGVRLYIDGKPAKFKIDSDTLYRPFRNAGAKFTEPVRIGGGWGADRRFRGLIDDVRIYSRVLDAGEVGLMAAGDSLNAIAAKPRANRTPGETQQLRLYFLEHTAPEEIRKTWGLLTSLGLEKEMLERTFPTVMVMADVPERRPTHRLIRGQYNMPGEVVEPGVPAALPPLPAGAPNNRLGFARWLVNPSNPLTARVAVNRFWQMFFGVGLVKTTEDFGVQGEWPSHPELLDWLAVDFVQSGWNVKRLLKLIVTSAAYRQSSRTAPPLTQKDPENRLLARGPRFRMPAEMVRDAALFEAGLLTEKLGGPSVKPYQPSGLWKEVVMQDMDYNQANGGDLYRRSLYTFWKRTVAPPMMANFDSAMRESCVVRENRTNTPLQALNLMNDVTFLESARFIGQRMLKEGGAGADSRLRYGFRLVTGRKPSAAEARVLRDSLQYHLDYFSGKEKDIEAYLAQGDSRPDPSLDKRELAAYGSVASLMLNLDEAVTKE